MIRIVPYTSVGGLLFGERRPKVLDCFGVPQNIRKNAQGETELHYPEFTVRLDADSDQFREFTALPCCRAAVMDIPITWDIEFLKALSRSGSKLQEVLGFVISLDYGLAISGFHDKNTAERAVHAFRRGDWDPFLHRMNSFCIDSDVE